MAELARDSRRPRLEAHSEEWSTAATGSQSMVVGNGVAEARNASYSLQIQSKPCRLVFTQSASWHDLGGVYTSVCIFYLHSEGEGVGWGGGGGGGGEEDGGGGGGGGGGLRIALKCHWLHTPVSEFWL